MKLIIAAGGTGGHIFPALAVAQEWRRCDPQVQIHWVGTARSREQELCAANDIDLTMLQVVGMPRVPGLKMITSLGAFAAAMGKTRTLFKRFDPDAVLAFGGYVCGPVLTTARLSGAPYFLHEQNAVPGMVNRMFAARAIAVFLGMPLQEPALLKGTHVLTGNPVRRIGDDIGAHTYPPTLNRSCRTVLVCGGSQGAQSMNRALLPAVKRWLDKEIQVVWQTGTASYNEMRTACGERPNLFMFDSVPDLYPWYAISRVVVGRAGASTIAEAGYFGLPCVLVPLPWSAGNHQYFNAGLVEGQGWGWRVNQDSGCGEAVDNHVNMILDNSDLFEQMSRKALDFAAAGAAATIVDNARELLAQRA